MPSVSLVDATSLDRLDSDAVAVVVGVHSSPDGPVPESAAGPIDEALGGRLSAALTAVGATGKPDEVVKIATLGLAPFPLVVATGLGEANGHQGEDANDRRYAARAGKTHGGAPLIGKSAPV